MEKNLKAGIVIVLVLIQAFLFCKVLSLHISTTLFAVSLCGVPLALACCVLLIRKPHWQYLDITMAMFAAGGLGMLIGYLADMNNLGLNGPFGLMSLCRAVADLPLSLDSLWFKLQSTPWMYIGMFVGGNAGMLLFESMRRVFSIRLKNLIDYTLCNIGMFMGMLLADVLSMTLTSGLDVFLGNAVMIVFMLLGMTLGMIALLHLSTYINKVLQFAYDKQQIA